MRIPGPLTALTLRKRELHPILQTLDRHLTAPAELTLFGRAALALLEPD